MNYQGLFKYLKVTVALKIEPTSILTRLPIGITLHLVLVVSLEFCSNRVFMPELFDPALAKTLKKDKRFLESTKLPILTVSGTYQEDLKRMHGLPNNDSIQDIVFSRAHYSMAVGVACEAWDDKQDPKKAWVADPTNYVSADDWFSVKLTDKVGKTIARYPFLKTLKDLIDRFGRQKLPILNSITEPLLYLTEHIDRPILSLHIATGNILVGQGKTVLQVITDPHVRYDYVTYADKPNLYYCVFDENTKLELLEKAALQQKKLDATRIFVTGSPVDPRIVACRNKKQPWRSGVLKLVITTGGLGTNKTEIEQLLQQFLPELRKQKPAVKLVVYAGTHRDIAEMVREMAKKYRVAIGEGSDRSSKLRLLYHPQIVDANELLIKYAFPWAHGFITKPSGDMTYDAVAAGCFVLTLQEWGEWEHRIREIFEQQDISRRATIAQILTQLAVLQSAQGKAQSWIERAMHNALRIDRLYLNGTKNIVAAYKQVNKLNVNR